MWIKHLVGLDSIPRHAEFSRDGGPFTGVGRGRPDHVAAAAAAAAEQKALVLHCLGRDAVAAQVTCQFHHRFRRFACG